MDYRNLNTLKLDSNARIINVLSKNKEVVDKFTGLQTAQEKLNIHQNKLVDLYSNLGKGKDSSANELLKNDQRKELVKTVLPVITMMQIFAYDKKKKKLLHRLELITPEYLESCSDIELISVSKKVWLIANKYGGYSLAFIKKIKKSLNADKLKAIISLEKKYGLLPGMIKNIEESNIRFIESLLIYGEEVREKEKIVRKIKKIDAKTENLLKYKIDRFVLLLKDENNDLFDNYHKAREIQLNADSTETNSLDQTIVTENILSAQNAVKQIKPKIQGSPKATEEVEV